MSGRACRPCLALLLLAACAEERPLEVPSDPEAAAVELLSAHVFDDLAKLRPRFTREADPAELPLRLIADGPEEYRFVDVWRARMIDGRLVVSALVELRGQARVFDLWLEEQDGQWRVAGWTQVPRPVDPAAPAPPAGVQVPAPFAPATFRGAPRIQLVPLDEPAPLEAADGAAPRMRVRFKAPAFQGDCPEPTVRRALDALTPRLATCGEAGRGGRLTFDLVLAPEGAEARLVETTLLDSALTDCARDHLETVRAPLAEGERCTVRAPLVLAPR